MPPDEEKDKEQKGFFQKYKWIIIGVVVIVGLIIFATVKGNPSSADEPVAIESVKAEVNALKLRVADEEDKSKSQADEIVDILLDIDSLQMKVKDSEISVDYADDIAQINNDLASLRSEVEAIEVIDWSSAIAILQGEIDALVAGGVTNTSLVTRVEGEYVDITVRADGDYPVFITLYGNGLETDKIERRYDSYDIIESWAVNMSGDVFLTVIVEPDDGWGAGDLIEIKTTTGTIDYVTAVVGVKQEGSGTGW